MKFKIFLRKFSLYSFIIVFAFISSFNMVPQKAQAQADPSEIPLESLWTGRGIPKISADGKKMYLGAKSFSYVDNSHFQTSGLVNGVVLDLPSANPTVSNPSLTGGLSVTASVSDGQGGWYVAGKVYSQNTEEIGEGVKIVHVLENGTLDSDFEVEIDDTNILEDVRAMAFDSSSNTLFFGGSFTTVNGQPRNKLAAVNANSGQLTSWSPNIGSGSTNSIRSMVVDSVAGVVYFGGYFTSVNGQTRFSAAAANTSDGQLTNWNPMVSPFSESAGVAGFVNSMVLDRSQNLVYLGGNFGCLNLPVSIVCHPVDRPVTSRTNVASVNSNTGVVTSFDPVESAGGDFVGITAMSLDQNGGVLYVTTSSYTYTYRGGQTRGPAAAINTSNGTVTPWVLPPLTYTNITSILFDEANNAVYLAGMLEYLPSGQDLSRKYRRFISVDADTGALIPTDPRVFNRNASTAAGTLRTMSLSPQGRLFVGGDNNYLRMPRSGLVEIDIEKGFPVRHFPQLNNFEISAMEIDHDNNKMYVSGGGHTVDGVYYRKLGVVDLSTGNLTLLTSNISGGEIKSMSLNKNSGVLYVAGTFTAINGTARNKIAAFNTANGQMTQFSPGHFNSVVEDIEVNPSMGVLYVGGSFTFIGNAPRNKLAALDLETGQVTAWNPNVYGLTTAAKVWDLELGENANTVYIGGSFEYVGGTGGVGGTPRSQIAEIDTSTGLVTAWDPNVSGGLIYSMDLDETTNSLYIGGTFDSVGGQTRSRLAAIDTVTGQSTSWNPNVSSASPGSYHVTYLALSPGATVLAIDGAFNSIGGSGALTPAVFDLPNDISSCLADFNEDDTVNNSDIFAFLSAWFAGNMSADANGNGTLEVPDIFAFLSSWYAGC